MLGDGSLAHLVRVGAPFWRAFICARRRRCSNMGATDVLPQLEAGGILKHADIRSLIGGLPCKIGVDGSMLIHMVLVRCKADILLCERWDGYLLELKREVEWIKSACPKSSFIVVLDGYRIAAKLANAHRNDTRKKAMDKVDGKWANDELPTKSEMSAAVGVHVIEAAEKLFACRCSLGVETYVAPGEAEHQLVRMQADGGFHHTHPVQRQRLHSTWR